MLTIEECFDKARRTFISDHQDLVSLVKREASTTAHSIGVSEDEYVDVEISKHFGKYLRQYGEDTVVTVLNMVVADSYSRNQLLTQHYTRIADALGMTLEEYVTLNCIKLNQI